MLRAKQNRAPTGNGKTCKFTIYGDAAGYLPGMP